MFLELFKKLDISLYTSRQKIEIVEWYLKNKIPKELTRGIPDYDYEHILQNGWYIRKIAIPKGDLVCGLVHKTTHDNFVLSGEVSIISDEFLFTAKSGAKFQSSKETKKMVYAHTDVVYATTHKTNKTNLDEIMKDTVYESDLSWIKELS